MMMFTGGAYQNKTALAMKMTGISEKDTADGAVCTAEEALSAKAVRNYHLLVKRLFQQGCDALAFTEKLCRTSHEAVIIMDEIGCGIVPVDREERMIRETVGRCGCLIAKNSHTVIRVCCGIPTYIKGEEK